MENVQRPNRNALKDIKRKEAAQRQAEHEALTPDEKLAKLDKRPGESRRERKRLTAFIEPVKPRRRRSTRKVTAQSIREGERNERAKH